MADIIDFIKARQSLKQDDYDYVCGEIDKAIAEIREFDPGLADYILAHVVRDPVNMTLMWKS